VLNRLFCVAFDTIQTSFRLFLRGTLGASIQNAPIKKKVLNIIQIILQVRTSGNSAANSRYFKRRLVYSQLLHS
jgi:hypothetical protein